LEEKLINLGCVIQKQAEVTSIAIVDGCPILGLNNEPSGEVTADYVVVAVPAGALATLVAKGAPGRRIVDKVPELSEVQRLRSEQIPVAYISFKKWLPGVPKEHVGLAGSKYYLTFLDISQLWPNLAALEKTVLVLAASDALAFPTDDPEHQAFLLIQELCRYLPKLFNPGTFWGDSEGDIDWDNSWVTAKGASRLFISEVGSSEWQPQPNYDVLPRVAFAGDFCLNNVDMATVEAAVLSGVQAAQSVQQHAGRGQAIVGVPYDGPGEAELLALKLALLPAAYVAKYWSTVDDAARGLASRNILQGAILPAQTLMGLPFNFALDWWSTAYDFWTNLYEAGVPSLPSLPGAEEASNNGPPVGGEKAPAADGLSTLAAKIASGLNDLLKDVAEYESRFVHGPPSAAPSIGPSALAFGLLNAARSIHRAARSPKAPPRPYRRRWRAKA
jgi:hypothetical protein